MTQQTELSRLIGEWDRLDPASPQSTALLMVLLAEARHLAMLDEQMAAVVDGLRALQPITASPTTDSPSDAGEQGSTPPPTPASSPSAQDATPTGPVELGSKCAPNSSHSWELWTLHPYRLPAALELKCSDCGVQQWFDLTPAQAAPTTSSTSQSGAASSSAESPAEAPAESPSSDWQGRIDTLSDLLDRPVGFHVAYLDADHVRLTPVAW